MLSSFLISCMKLLQAVSLFAQIVSSKFFVLVVDTVFFPEISVILFAFVCATKIIKTHTSLVCIAAFFIYSIFHASSASPCTRQRDLMNQHSFKRGAFSAQSNQTAWFLLDILHCATPWWPPTKDFRLENKQNNNTLVWLALFFCVQTQLQYKFWDTIPTLEASW